MGQDAIDHEFRFKVALGMACTVIIIAVVVAWSGMKEQAEQRRHVLACQSMCDGRPSKPIADGKCLCASFEWVEP